MSVQALLVAQQPQGVIAISRNANQHLPDLAGIGGYRVLDPANPLRFKGKPPSPLQPPAAVWINPPAASPAGPQEPPEQH